MTEEQAKHLFKLQQTEESQIQGVATPTAGSSNQPQETHEGANTERGSKKSQAQVIDSSNSDQDSDEDIEMHLLPAV